MEILYRVLFKDGTHGAWGTDKERALKSAKFFCGIVEAWDRETHTYTIIRP